MQQKSVHNNNTKNERVLKMDKHILSGVNCDVKSCIYNRSGKECSASSIKVDSTCNDPSNCDETACRTFIGRD